MTPYIISQALIIDADAVLQADGLAEFLANLHVEVFADFLKLQLREFAGNRFFPL